jgi:hypothetical protein
VYHCDEAGQDPTGGPTQASCARRGETDGRVSLFDGDEVQVEDARVFLCRPPAPPQVPV